MNMGTIGAALTGAVALLKGETPSPQLDAEVLLGHLLKRPRPHLLAHREEDVPGKTLRAYTSLVRRRGEGIPLPYLTGATEFYGRPFIVTPAVMVPRPESETLVEEAIRLLEEIRSTKHEIRNKHEFLKPKTFSRTPISDFEHSDLFRDSNSGFRISRPIVADIGTGSGVLAVTIAAEAARVHVVATDKSAAALIIARRNAKRQKIANRMTFIESDLLTEIPLELAPSIIVANLPYVPSDDLKYAKDSLETRGLTFEPQKALDGGPDGLFVIRRFFAQLTRWKLKDHLRHLVLEHSPTGARRILELAHDALPNMQHRQVSPFVTSWTGDSRLT